MRDDGREPRIVEVKAGEATTKAVGGIHRELVKEEGVAPERIAVLVGGSLARSGLWRRRRFAGNLVLWNGSVNDVGESLGLSADEVPDQPPGTILVETIYRSKGLDWDVVVLAELRPDDPDRADGHRARLTTLLYVGASRARHHLVVITPPGVAPLSWTVDG
jgi:hypothetical protein